MTPEMAGFIWVLIQIAIAWLLSSMLYKAYKWRESIIMGEHLKVEGQFLRGYRDGLNKQDDGGRKLLSYAMKEGYFNLYLFGAACAVADEQGKPHPKPWGKF